MTIPGPMSGDGTGQRPGARFRPQSSGEAPEECRPLSQHLLSQDDDPADVFLDREQARVTTVTRFFRNRDLLVATRAALAAYMERRLSGPLTMWSCGCSSGEELYSMVMIAQEELSRMTVWRRMRAYGTDIHPDLVASARKGVYRCPNMKSMDPGGWHLLEKYAEITDRELRIRDAIRNLCSFTRFDIRRQPRRHTFHFIVCNHVLQYYDDEAQRRIVANLRAVLQPGGLLYLEGVPEHIIVGEMGLTKAGHAAKLYRAKE